MAGLKQMLKNKMDDDRSFATKVSKIAGYANPTGFYKFLNKDESEFKDIQKLIEIVQYAFPDCEFSIMDEYIRTLNPNNVLARQALEYANINKLDSLFEFLLDELSACSNAESKEWAAVYRIDWDAENKRITPLEAINILNDLTVKSKEMKVYKEIAKFYCYNDRRLIGIMNEMSCIIQDSLSNLNEDYIKRKYECRYHILMADVYLHTDKIDQLREIVTISISKVNNKNLLARLYHHLGLSYLVTDYEKCHYYLDKGLKISESNDNQLTANNIKRSLNFANSYWGKQHVFIDVFNDENSMLADRAFNMSNFSKEESLKILLKVNIEEFSNFGKAYYYLYLGIITERKDYLYKSIEFFNLAGEKFLKRMPINKLKEMGEHEYILQAMLA